MKKIYKTPNTKVVKAMVSANLLAGSLGVNDDPINNVGGGAKGFYPDFEEEEEMDGYGWY